VSSTEPTEPTEPTAPREAGRLTLRRAEVVIRVDPAAPPAALGAAAALASMAARLAGHVVVPAVALPRPNPWGARTLTAVTGTSRFGRGGRHAVTKRVTVGEGPHAVASDLYVGGDDWTAVVSREGPVPVGPCPLGGLGVQVAAALAFGEVVKDLLPGPRQVRIEDELRWSLLTGRVGEAAAATGVGLEVTRPRIALLGAGSVGSSVAALLALTGLRGVVDVVDPDSFDPVRNAYRCPGVPAAEHGSKAEWAAGTLGAAGWEAAAHRATVAEWAEARAEAGFPGLALVCVDNVDGRREAAELLAATTVSAGVGGVAFHVQRHLPADDLACPYCDLVDAGRWRSQAGTYARLGVTGPRLQALLDGDVLTTDDVAKAIWAGAVDPGVMASLAGGHLVDLLRRPAVLAPQVSAPHVSWLAGALVAAEVVKVAAGLPGLDRRVDLDLAGVPLGGWRRPIRNPSGRCPCSNPDRRRLAHTLYGP
jgi:hypothetical protein